MSKFKPAEHFDHDDCPKCGTPSVPFEGVTDQTLRGCPDDWCCHEWFEDLDLPPSHGINPEHYSLTDEDREDMQRHQNTQGE